MLHLAVFLLLMVLTHYPQSHLPEIFSLFPPARIITADSPEVAPGRGKPCPDIFLAAAHSLGPFRLNC